MSIIDSVSARLGPSPTFRCALCGDRYERERDHCPTCGSADIRGADGRQ